MDNNDQDVITISLLTLGEVGVGKTSLSTRFMKDVFSENYLATIGVDFYAKEFVLPSCVLKLTVWDTAGQEKLRSVTANFLRKAEGALICYDITNKESFEKITYWIQNIKDRALDVPIVIVGNKIDSKDEQFENEKNEAEEFAKKNNYDYFRCSAKTGENVEQAFYTLIKLVMEKKENDSSELCRWLKDEKKICIGECSKLKGKAKRSGSKKQKKIKLEKDSSSKHDKKKKCCK